MELLYFVFDAMQSWRLYDKVCGKKHAFFLFHEPVIGKKSKLIFVQKHQDICIVYKPLYPKTIFLHKRDQFVPELRDIFAWYFLSNNGYEV